MPPQTRIPAFCTQCRSRCGCEAVVEDGRLVGIEPLATHPSGAKLCPKGKAAPELVYHPDRIQYPMRRTAPKSAADPKWQRITWDEALDEIAARLSSIARAHGPEQVAFSVTTPSGAHISDAISWIERFIQGYGSPNTIYATEICNWHKDFATRFTFGHDIGTPDFANADCILLWGNNPATTWLARHTEIQKGLKRGARLVVVDPRPTVLARRATTWLPVRPGTDLVLALGLINAILSQEKFDAAYARQWTNAGLLVRTDTGAFLKEQDLVADGREDVLFAATSRGTLLAYDCARRSWNDRAAEADLYWRGMIETPHGTIACRTALDMLREASADYLPDRVAEETGVPAHLMLQAASTLGSAASVAYYTWNGVGQSVTATQTNRAMSILYGLLGHYGRQGGNVPGSAAPFADISGRELMSPEQRRKTLGLSERPLGPGVNGWVTARQVYDAVTLGAPYPVKMLFSFGTNMLVSHPEQDLARQALAKLDFHVHADFFVNATAQFADILLPAATSWEREGLRTGFDSGLEGLRQVQLRPAIVAPVGEARSDTDIVLGLASRLGMADAMFNLDVDAGHDAILARSGLTVEMLRANPGGIRLATAAPLDAHQQRVDDGFRGFPTPTGLIEVYSENLHRIGQAPIPRVDATGRPRDAGFPLLLSSAKTIAFCHSQHRNIPSLRRLNPAPLLEISQADAETRSITHGDWIEVRTRAGRTIAKAVILQGLAPGSVFAQHGWWEPQPDGAHAFSVDPLAASMNKAIATDRADPISGSLPMRETPCEIVRIETPAHLSSQ